VTADADRTFERLHRAIADEVGAIIFTVSMLDRKAGVSRRAYTSHPDDYPVTGTKPMDENAWSAQVIDGRRTFVANTTEEFAPLFFDHALINALGCQSAVNIPVVAGGDVVGTVNLLDVEGHYTPARVARAEALVAAAAAGLAAALGTGQRD